MIRIAISVEAFWTNLRCYLKKVFLGEATMKAADLTVSTWSDLHNVLDDFATAGWAFRGQADANWPLESSLTRYLRAFVDPNIGWLGRERQILHAFKRKAHPLLPRTPEPSETLEWLALMQHHGAPTRLIDFSWSPYVAAFFALERATADAAIWGIASNPQVPNYQGFEISVLLNEVPRLNDRSASKADSAELCSGKDIPAVVIGEPVLMNQRMTTQVGTFAVPIARSDVALENLVPPDSVFKLKLVTESLRKKSMERLHNMNLTNASLFPGVDGFARSLAYELEFKWKVDLEALERLRKAQGHDRV
jgi:hypothetical protein